MEQSKKSVLREYFPDEEIESARNIINVFHEKLLLDDKLSGGDALLIALYMCSNKSKMAEVNYNEVKNLFVKLGRKENDFKVYLHYANKAGLIDEREEANKTKLISLKIKGLKIVKDLLGHHIGAKVWLIESGMTYSGKKLFKEIVSPKVDEVIKICDPYCGIRLLDILGDVLSEIKTNCKIYLLTRAIERKEQFKRELEDFKKEFPNIEIEVRILEDGKLHDRYIITGTDYWSVGTSIKDIGRKDALITKLPDEVKHALKEIFNKRWESAKPLY
jgi:hypothetical protein